MSKEEWQDVLQVDCLPKDELLVLRCDDSAAFDSLQDHLEDISSLLDEARVTAVIMPKGFHLEKLPEAEMNRYGWIRKDA